VTAFVCGKVYMSQPITQTSLLLAIMPLYPTVTREYPVIGEVTMLDLRNVANPLEEMFKLNIADHHCLLYRDQCHSPGAVWFPDIVHFDQPWELVTTKQDPHGPVRSLPADEPWFSIAMTWYNFCPARRAGGDAAGREEAVFLTIPVGRQLQDQGHRGFDSTSGLVTYRDSWVV
jgi:hypothetical protein